MMPFGSECCKGSKLHVDLFLESYTRRTTHNGILKNCTVANIAIKADRNVTRGLCPFYWSS